MMSEDHPGVKEEDRMRPPVGIIFTGCAVGAACAAGIFISFSGLATTATRPITTTAAEKSFDLCKQDRWIMEQARMLSRTFKGRRLTREQITQSMGHGGVLRYAYADWVRQGKLPLGRERSLVHQAHHYADHGLVFGPRTLEYTRQTFMTC